MNTKVLVGKPEGKRPLGGHRHRWEDIIKMVLREKGCEVVDWIHLAQERDLWRGLVNTAVNLLVPYKAGNFLTMCVERGKSPWYPLDRRLGEF
jgi:hypothetical protein